MDEAEKSTMDHDLAPFQVNRYEGPPPRKISPVWYIWGGILMLNLFGYSLKLTAEYLEALRGADTRSLYAQAYDPWVAAFKEAKGPADLWLSKWKAGAWTAPDAGTRLRADVRPGYAKAMSILTGWKAPSARTREVIDKLIEMTGWELRHIDEVATALERNDLVGVTRADQRLLEFRSKVEREVATYHGEK